MRRWRVGTHPYLCIGDVDTSELVLTSPGATRFTLDERKLPVAEEPGGCRAPTSAAGAASATSASTRRTASCRATPTAACAPPSTAPDGRMLTLWQGEGFDYVQVFTTDRYPGQPVAVAVEPMTAPADALNSGQGLRWLDPGRDVGAALGHHLRDA